MASSKELCNPTANGRMRIFWEFHNLSMNLQEGAISDANLRLLVDKIIITEKDKKLNIKIKLNAKFKGIKIVMMKTVT